jgi:hypothetical protein
LIKSVRYPYQMHGFRTMISVSFIGSSVAYR